MNQHEPRHGVSTTFAMEPAGLGEPVTLGRLLQRQRPRDPRAQLARGQALGQLAQRRRVGRDQERLEAQVAHGARARPPRAAA